MGTLSMMKLTDLHGARTYDLWLFCLVCKQIKPPGTGSYFLQRKRDLTLDQLWILSSRGLLALCPVSHCDSSAARKNKGNIARDLVAEGEVLLFSFPWLTLEPHF